MSERHTKLSRMVSHALRHRPDLYGLELDEAGWVSIDRLVSALARRGREWRGLTAEDLHAMAAGAAKQRYEIRAGRIRAHYGHSTARKIEKAPAKPPEILYHGTTDVALAKIREEGLKPMRRQYVHLSPDRETAAKVAERRTEAPVIVTVLAGLAHADGVAFYHGNDDVWLSEPLAARYLRLPER